MKNNYGFLNKNQLSKANFIEKEISDLKDFKWNITKTYSTVAKNHCGAILVANLYNYYFNDTDVFLDVFKIVKNGPVLFLTFKAKRFFNQYNLKLDSKMLFTNKAIIKSINLNHPIALLLKKSLFNWHWVLCIGYRQYQDKLYLKIIDGWSKTYKYYLINDKSLLVYKSSLFLRKGD